MLKPKRMIRILTVLVICIVTAFSTGCREEGATSFSSKISKDGSLAISSDLKQSSDSYGDTQSMISEKTSFYSNNSNYENSNSIHVANSSGKSVASSKVDTAQSEALIKKYLFPLLNTTESFTKQGFSNFITLKNNRLYDGDKKYRFMSVNLPSVQYNIDAGQDDKWMRSSPFEIDDAIKTVSQMGGQVARIHTLSIRRENQSIIRNVYGPGKYDELMMRDLDLVLAYANKNKVRIFMPIFNPWYFIGANYDFDRECGGAGTAYSFYHNANTRSKFKELLNYLLNRTNYYTGVKYKDDKAIMGWELGNELNQPWINKSKLDGGEGQDDGLVTDEWIYDIASYIKSIDPNHLIANGGQWDPSPAVLACENIDIITMHYISPLGYGTIADSVDKITRDQFINSGKAYIHGEFDPVNELNEAFLEKCLKDTYISGAMAWSLRGHAKTGGFLCHNDWNKAPLRWPGFSNGMNNEVWKLWKMREYSYKMQGIPIPNITKPEPPILLPITSTGMISFRGSVGSDNYILERADSEKGPWKIISNNVTENQYRFFKPYSDTTADLDKDYFYRLTAQNRAGKSEVSNIIPYRKNEIIWIDMEEETFGKQFVDEFNSLLNAFSTSGEDNITLSTSEYRDQYNFSALKFSGTASLMYKFDKEIADYFIFIGWNKDDYKAISVQLSKEGKTFINASPKLCDYGDANGQHFGRLEQFPVPSGYKYLRIAVTDRAGLIDNLEIGRIEVNFK